MKFILKENQKPLFRLYIDFSLTNFNVYDFDILSNDFPYVFQNLKEKNLLQKFLNVRLIPKDKEDLDELISELYENNSIKNKGRLFNYRYIINFINRFKSFTDNYELVPEDNELISFVYEDLDFDKIFYLKNNCDCNLTYTLCSKYTMTFANHTLTTFAKNNEIENYLSSIYKILNKNYYNGFVNIKQENNKAIFKFNEDVTFFSLMDLILNMNDYDFQNFDNFLIEETQHCEPNSVDSVKLSLKLAETLYGVKYEAIKAFLLKRNNEYRIFFFL